MGGMAGSEGGWPRLELLSPGSSHASIAFSLFYWERSPISRPAHFSAARNFNDCLKVGPLRVWVRSKARWSRGVDMPLVSVLVSMAASHAKQIDAAQIILSQIRWAI